MKKILSLVLAAVFMTGVIPNVSAETTAGPEKPKINKSIRYGEYREERLGELGEQYSLGLLFFPDREMMYDFDREEMPEGVSFEKSTGELSSKYYAAPWQDEINNSLKWTTQGAGSTVSFESGNPIVPTGYDWRHMYYLNIGLFQREMPEDGSTRAFEVQMISNGNVLRSYTVYLHRIGWSFLGQNIGRSGFDYPSGTKVDSVLVRQIAGPAGDIYIDNVMVYICNAGDWVNTPYIQEEKLPSEKAKDYPTHPLTEEEREAFSKIARKIVPDLEPIDRIKDEKMEDFREYYNSWKIEVTDDGFVNSMMPLNFHRAAPGWTPLNDGSYQNGGSPTGIGDKFRDICVSYNRVQDPEQKEILKKYVIDFTLLMLTYSNLPATWYAGSGTAEGWYYAQDVLIEAGLSERVSSQLKQQFNVEKLLYKVHEMGRKLEDGTYDTDFNSDADSLYNAGKSTLLTIITDADSPEKARDYYRLKSLLDNVLLNYTPSLMGTLKPDGSLYHHSGYKFDYGWRQAWNGMTEYAYWLDDTPFALEPETIERLNYFAEVRFKTLDINERVGTPDQNFSGVGSNGILRLAQIGTPDGELEVNPYRAAEWMMYGGKNAEEQAKYLEMGIQPAGAPQTNNIMSYAALDVHRRSSWKVQTYASSKFAYHNEYSRPATLFYNLAGMAFSTTGDHSAMLNKPGDNIYGRDTFVPAQGYNFSRAPGVTAPNVDPANLRSPGQQKGNSDFVGGVSTKNGNGVFVVPFDASKLTKTYSGTPAAGFKFNKSYFYFDDTIVSLASDIGYPGGEKMTTGLFQEKAADTDTVLMAGDITLGDEDYSNTYTSDEAPWLTDNLQNIGLYLFPGQSYTAYRGEQTFLFKAPEEGFNGKGRYTGAYINHDSNEVRSGKASYAYVLLPNPTKEKMERYTESMQSDNPEVEIIRRDSMAHIVRSNKLNSTGYVLFDKNVKLDEGFVKSVSAPVTLMTKEYEGGRGLSLAVSEPGLRMDATPTNPLGWSVAKNVSVTLKGKWRVKSEATYTARENGFLELKYNQAGDTVITVSCKDGLTNELLLENLETPLSSNLEKTLTFTPCSDTAEVNGEQTKLLAPVKTVDGVNYAAIADVAKLLDSEAEWSPIDKRARLVWNDKVVTITLNSKIMTVDSNMYILESPVFVENDRYFVPLNALKDILKSNVDMDSEKHTISYIRNDAEWKSWDEAPKAPEAPYLNSLSIGGEPVEFDKRITSYNIELEDGTQEIPEITFELNEDYKATVTYPDILPGQAEINVTDNNDKLNINQYKIWLGYPKSNYVITASHIPQPENSPENTMDDNLESYWGSDTLGCFISYDVGEEVSFEGIGIAFASGDKRTSQFEVEVSKDGQTWTNVYTGSSSGKTLQIQKFDFAPITGRFIRIVGKGNSGTGGGWNSISEVVIYKKKLQ